MLRRVDSLNGTHSPGTDSGRIERLVGLCRIWGAAKFFHPYLAYRDIDWDAALVSAIPLVDAAEGTDDYADAIAHLLTPLEDRGTRVLSSEEADEVLGDEMFHTDVFGGEPALLWRDKTAVMAAAQLTGLAGGPALAETVEAWLTEMETADSVIFDLRGSTGYFVTGHLANAAPRLLEGTAPHPSTRHRMHSGYSSGGSGSGMYNSGFYVTDAHLLRGVGGALAQKPLSFLLDRSSGAPDWVLALQSAGRAAVVFVGDPGIVAPGEIVDLPDGIRVWLRTSELIRPEGQLGFRPDLTVEPAEPGDDYFADAAVMAALESFDRMLIRSESNVGPIAGVTTSRSELAYQDTPFPDREHRLLALFRYWTVMDLFFPYKAHLDRAWDEVLREGIPLLEAATDETEYSLALAAVNANARDTHCFLFSDAFRKWVGTHCPSLLVRLIEGRTVVIHAAPEIEGLGLGDVVLSIDGEPVEVRQDRLRPYYSASTPQAMDWRIHSTILNGDEGSEAAIEIERADGSRATVTVARDQTYVPRPDRDLPTFGVLPSGFGYFDLARLIPGQVDEAFEAVRDTPALIIDDRCYPNGTAWPIAPRLADGEVVAALFSRPERRSTSPDVTITYEMQQRLGPSSDWKYKKPVAVLIYGESISQAEHTCLFLEAACDPTFVGSATNGANGDVTNIPLPGGVVTMFSGHDVRHADGRQLQRVGIQPHFEVHPSIAGIREGRDEVLEAAEAFLAGRTSGGNADAS